MVGDNVNGDLALGEAVDTNPASNTNINLIPKRTFVEVNDVYRTDTEALKYAEFLLKRKIRVNKSISFTCAPVYHLKVDDVIQVTDSDIGLDRERLIINSINISFGDSGVTMSINATQTRDIEL